MKNRSPKIRYAVLGLGHIAQAAVLPAFKHASANSVLGALVSDEPKKLRALGRKYKVGALWTYKEYALRLQSGAVDAAYIALPNHLHRKSTLESARAGVHVLCEKPLALSEREGREMVEAAAKGGVKLMCAYRLHLDPLTLKALEWVRRGRVGEPRFLRSVLSMDVPDPGNIRRLPASKGGGPLYDLGVYSVNAARTFFQAEPVEVSAMAGPGERTVLGLLRFSEGRLAGFACSTESGELSQFTLSGSLGNIHGEDAFDYALPRRLRLERKGQGQALNFPRSDQFAAELVYFSDCILKNRRPQPDGVEGLADLRVITALRRSIATGRVQKLGPFPSHPRPDPGRSLRFPPVREPKELEAKAPSQR